jgi:uncharacterized membrane protein YkoI
MKTAASLLVTAALALTAPALACAQPLGGDQPHPNSLGEGYSPQQDEARRGVRQGGQMPLSSVISSIQRQHPGRQLDTGIEDRNGRTVYRVRWEDRGGHRMDFIVDARTGAVLSVEGR